MSGVALVTGGSGFIGWWVTRALAARGCAVRVLDVHPPPEELPGVEFAQGSILDPEALREAMRGVDRAHHLAAMAGLWSRERGLYERLNHQGTRAALDAAMEAGVRRFVHVSSATALAFRRGRSARRAALANGAPPLPAAEETLGPYSRSKNLAERAAYAAAERGLGVVVATVTTPIGPGDRTRTPPTQLLIDLMRGDVPATLPMAWRLSDVRDTAEGIAAAGEVGEAGRRYMLHGETWTTERLLEAVGEASGRPMPRARAPFQLALAAAHAGEALSRVTGRAPKASVEGVRLARAEIDLSKEAGAEDLGVTIRPAEESISDAVAWLREREAVSG